MCFSNLPVEFDDEGNPTLGEAADEVEHFDGCDCDADLAIDASDSVAVYEEVLESLPEYARKGMGVETAGSPEETGSTGEPACETDARGD